MTRALFLLLSIALIGCGKSPQDWGLTGPGTSPAPPPAPDDSVIGAPGLPDYGNSYGPSIGTTPTPGRFFNYN